MQERDGKIKLRNGLMEQLYELLYYQQQHSDDFENWLNSLRPFDKKAIDPTETRLIFDQDIELIQLFKNQNGDLFLSITPDGSLTKLNREIRLAKRLITMLQSSTTEDIQEQMK
ncbi:MAG: hypothetical protein HWE30_03425 [Methylocystaceae bacterium]|nr:hypothetical protein [Methylocystaceae bacterium]